MAHAQKPDLVFQRNGRVHFNRRGGGSVQSTTGSRGVRISGSNGSNAGCTMFWGRVQDCWLPTPLACFPFTSHPVRHRVPSGFNWALLLNLVRNTASDAAVHWVGNAKLKKSWPCSRTKAYKSSSRYICTHFNTGARWWLSGRPIHYYRPLHPVEKKPRHSSNRRLGGAHSRSGRFGEGTILLLVPEFEPRTVQLAASRNTHYASPGPSC
jgi:hypothetical protein